MEFTLRGIDLVVPLVPFSFSRTAIAGIPAERQPLLASYGRQLALSIGVYALGGLNVAIESCTFLFESSDTLNVFGAGVFAARDVEGLEIADCDFTAPGAASMPFSGLARGAAAVPPYQVRFGYLQVPTRSQDVSFRPLLMMAPASTDVPLETNVPLDAAPGVSNRAAAAAAKRAAAEAAAAAAAAAAVGVPSLADAVIERNLFDGLAVPVLVMGQVGTARIEDNTVRRCYGGFWLVTTSTTRALSMLDRVSVGTNAVWSYLISSRLTSLADPVLLIASVLGRILPLTPPSTEATSDVGAILLPSAPSLKDAQSLLLRLNELPTKAEMSVAGLLGAQKSETTGTVTGEAAVAGRPALATELPSRIVSIFKVPAHAATRDLVPEVDPGTALIPRLDVSANQVDAVLADADSAAALFVLALDTTRMSSLVCTGNRFRSRVVQGATVSLWALAECAVTGNIVSNEIPGAENDKSIVLEPETVGKAPAVAVTGNVLVGPVVLPPRPNPAPFDTWFGLNTITNYITP